ncbi:MAG: NADAR family protein [Bacteroidales bacterium]|nr:NADAR family protein [Bacteroidales bacterium]
MESNNIRQYPKDSCIVFRKTKEKYGGLSNMASGFPICLGKIYLKSSEALYQSLRYPEFPNIQQEIILQRSPMTAKMISKKYYSFTRPDWESVKYNVMRICLELKLFQNWEKFSAILNETDNLPIVEFAPKGKVWGAIDKGTYYEGINALGRLLMELRKEFVFEHKPKHLNLRAVPNLKIINFDLREIDPEHDFVDNCTDFSYNLQFS